MFVLKIYNRGGKEQNQHHRKSTLWFSAQTLLVPPIHRGKVCMLAQGLSCVRLFVTSWTVACQVPLSMGFSGKNTGGRCRFLLQQCSESCSVMSDFLRPHRLHSSRNSLGQNTGMGSLSLLQGIFPTQGSNPGLPHCKQILYQLSHQGSPTEVKHKSPNMMRENLINRPCVSLTLNVIAPLLTRKKEEPG